MNIIGAEIEWYDDYANSPTLRVTTDGPIPRREALRYSEHFITTRSSGLSREQEAVVGFARERDLHILYAEDPSGYVSFIAVGAETSHCGASGGHFSMEDGTSMYVRSGWTISSSAIRDIADVVECSYRDNPRSRMCMAAFILADRTREIIEEFLPDVEMYDDGSGWTFRWIDAPTKPEWQRVEHERFVDDPSYVHRPYSQAHAILESADS